MATTEARPTDRPSRLTKEKKRSTRRVRRADLRYSSHIGARPLPFFAQSATSRCPAEALQFLPGTGKETARSAVEGPALSLAQPLHQPSAGPPPRTGEEL